jgi:hypothetical protein
MIVLLVCIGGFLPWLPVKQFSLRALLIAMTLIALGLIALGLGWVVYVLRN